MGYLIRVVLFDYCICEYKLFSARIYDVLRKNGSTISFSTKNILQESAIGIRFFSSSCVVQVRIELGTTDVKSIDSKSN